MSTKSIKPVDFIVAVGSVDGVCTAAAVLRNANPDAGLVFTQAFAVDKLDPATWGEGRTVMFVDLAVNNRDEQMTVDFLKRVAAAGHDIVSVCDEHNAEDWKRAFESAGLNFNDLTLKPVTGKGTDTNSSGALFLRELEDIVLADEHIRELCLAADAGDRMDFTTHFGGLVNQAVKSKIQDDARRVYLARHFAQNRDADATIAGWVAEYEEILRNHEEIVGARVDLGDGLTRVVTTGKTIDVTTFMSRLYGLGYKVAVVDGEVFVPAKKVKERQISFGCAPQVKIDLVAALKAAGINASGFAQKANIDPADEEAALPVIKSALAAATS